MANRTVSGRQRAAWRGTVAMVVLWVTLVVYAGAIAYVIFNLIMAVPE